jgi:hypothetical protein
LFIFRRHPDTEVSITVCLANSRYYSGASLFIFVVLVYIFGASNPVAGTADIFDSVMALQDVEHLQPYCVISVSEKAGKTDRAVSDTT